MSLERKLRRAVEIQMMENNEQDLIGRSVAGDELALKRLLYAHHDRLAAHIDAKMSAMLRRTTDSDDILQDTYEQVWRHIRTFEAKGDGAFYGWLVKIADRKLLDRIKSQRTQKRGGRVATMAAASGDSAARLLDALADDGESPSRADSGAAHCDCELAR